MSALQVRPRPGGMIQESAARTATPRQLQPKATRGLGDGASPCGPGLLTPQRWVCSGTRLPAGEGGPVDVGAAPSEGLRGGVWGQGSRPQSQSCPHQPPAPTNEAPSSAELLGLCGVGRVDLYERMQAGVGLRPPSPPGTQPRAQEPPGLQASACLGREPRVGTQRGGCSGLVCKVNGHQETNTPCLGLEGKWVL